MADAFVHTTVVPCQTLRISRPCRLPPPSHCELPTATQRLAMAAPHSSCPTVDSIPLSHLHPSPTRTPAAPQTPRPAPSKPGLWSILKDAVRKDLSRMTIPVVFNEPLSFLQRLAEDVEYSHLLDKAAHPSLAATPERIALIAAFIVSHYSSTANRASKPFNPLLGETYDLVDPDRGIALVAEQVSHHPPTAALFVQGNGWQYHLAHEIKNKFLGNTLQVWPEGTVHIKFDDGEHYVYDQAYTLVHNIIMGELWIDNVGTITIRELTNPKYMASLDFKRYAAVFSEAKKLGDISGRVYPISSTGSKGKSVRKLTGNWNSHVNVDGKSVWIANPHPEKVETAGCNMTAWAWRLNPPVLDEDHVMYLPKTDSRFRPDQRALENAEYKLASTEKDRLESDQRTRRKQEDNGNVNWNPLWFEMQFNPTTGKKEWRYRHNYFAAKENGCWPCRVPSIF